MSFVPARFVHGLPHHETQRLIRIVLSTQAEGVGPWRVLRLQFSREDARALRDALAPACEEGEGSREPAHCAVRPEVGRSGDARPAGPVPSLMDGPWEGALTRAEIAVTFDSPEHARRRGRVDCDRGRKLADGGNPYDPVNLFPQANAWAEGWLERWAERAQERIKAGRSAG